MSENMIGEEKKNISVLGILLIIVNDLILL